MHIGLDIVRVRRVAGVLARSTSFAGSAYTPSELAACAHLPARRRSEFLAGRLAVKEAVLKALGAGGAERSALLDVETLPDANGAPTVTLYGDALRRAHALGASTVAVSISHEAGTAAAVAILR